MGLAQGGAFSGFDLGGTLSPYGAAPSFGRSLHCWALPFYLETVGLGDRDNPSVSPSASHLPLHRGGFLLGDTRLTRTFLLGWGDHPRQLKFGRQEMLPQPSCSPHATVESDVKSLCPFSGRE